MEYVFNQALHDQILEFLRGDNWYHYLCKRRGPGAENYREFAILQITRRAAKPRDNKTKQEIATQLDLFDAEDGYCV